MKSFLLKPQKKENWLVNLKGLEDSDYRVSCFYKGILLANEQDKDNYIEVTNEWKERQEYGRVD